MIQKHTYKKESRIFAQKKNIMHHALPIHFAPLQGYTEASYRNAHAACFGGIDAYHTPFVRMEKNSFRNKDIREILPEHNHVVRLIPQLIAPSVEKAEAILSLFIEKGYKEVDFNLGCPFLVLAKRHNGAGILPYPEEVKALLSLIEKHPEISFSIKMRLGWEHADECLQLASIINNIPLRHVTMHPRLGKQQYKGEVDMKGFSDFQEVCNHPLIYNGDMHTLADLQRIQQQFPTLAGVMIGRGLLANPALALEYKENRTLSPDEMKEKLSAMHMAVYNQYALQIEGGDAQLLNKMKTFWEYLMPQADRKLLKAIHKSTSISKYQLATSVFFNKYTSR